jgi:hypothetical protein
MEDLFALPSLDARNAKVWVLSLNRFKQCLLLAIPHGHWTNHVAVKIKKH